MNGMGTSPSGGRARVLGEVPEDIKEGGGHLHRSCVKDSFQETRQGSKKII